MSNLIVADLHISISMLCKSSGEKKQFHVISRKIVVDDVIQFKASNSDEGGFEAPFEKYSVTQSQCSLSVI